MRDILVVAAGGGIGAALRHLAGLVALRTLGPSFPYGTMIVNVVGSLLMGLVIEWFVRRGGGTQLRLLLATGLLGGFTTFSSFSLDAVALWQRGEGVLATGYVVGSVALGLAGLVAGLVIGRAVF